MRENWRKSMFFQQFGLSRLNSKFCFQNRVEPAQLDFSPRKLGCSGSTRVSFFWKVELSWPNPICFSKSKLIRLNPIFDPSTNCVVPAQLDIEMLEKLRNGSCDTPSKSPNSRANRVEPKPTVGSSRLNSKKWKNKCLQK